MAALKEKVLQWIDENITEKRKGHILRVSETAVQLAIIHGASVKKAELAGLMHDMYRFHDQQQRLNDLIYRLQVDEKYVDDVKLGHSKIAAAALEKDWGVTDREILDAISYHTTGRAHMTLLDKVLYLADAIEPAREYPKVEELRKLAKVDLDAACLALLENTKAFVESRGTKVDQDTIAAIHYLKGGNT